ncbi:sigma-70 family RNA polymerase sigma factor [Pelatocladus sp. BLCC-F211]|uniref:sigma-70 family RNA polymerase sigma factor n=1 Tax=Pelatocladus sp. BLCC-F211 TaxID=3342752 RepID=UPI0035BB7935
MDEFKAQILQLVQQACQQPRGSLERKRELNKIIYLIQKSGKLLRSNGVPDAEEALQQTWIYFCQNLCEATTAKEAYNPNKGCVTCWLNIYLNYRLKDIYHRRQERDKKIISPFSGENGEEIDPVNLIPAPPEPSPIIKDIREWLTTEAKKLQRIHISDRPDINCQVLIERRFFLEVAWKDISQDFGVSIPTLSGFYQRKCLPILEEFCKSQGYLD